MKHCDVCNKPATYDAKTIQGPWAYLCDEHYKKYGLKVKGLYSDLEKGK